MHNTSKLKLKLVAVLTIGLWLSGHAEEFRVVVAGDGRAEYPWASNNTRPEDADGINQRITREIRDAVKEERAQVFLWTGDIVNVNERAGAKDEDKTKFLRTGLNEWCAMMKELYKENGFKKVLPVRGNHELEWREKDPKAPLNPIADAANQWREAFEPLELPSTGPTDEKNLSFYWTDASTPALFIGLDQYENRRHMVNQSWLDSVLERSKNDSSLSKPFIFAYGHEPAFVTGGSHPSAEELAAHPRARDHMWKSLADAGAKVYFCGHDHLYDRMRVKRTGFPEMYQITAGTAGAPFNRHVDYPQDEDWDLHQAKHIDFVYGYVLITISGNVARIEFKGRNLDGKYESRDSFVITAGE